MNTLPMDAELLENLTRMRIEPEGARLTFAARLARENCWSVPYAQRVVREYARFLYLAVKAGHSVTPSDEVDQAWHLHLAYTRHYWGVLCAQILGRPLHHGPTAGGADEGTRYRRQYQETLAAYRTHFGAAPPADIWPDAERRFSARFTRVETGRHWRVPKPLGVIAVAAPLLASCVTIGAASGGGLILFLMLGIGGFLLVKGLIHATRGNGRKNDGSGCSGCSTGGMFGDDSDSGCSGDSGCGGCGGD